MATNTRNDVTDRRWYGDAYICIHCLTCNDGRFELDIVPSTNMTPRAATLKQKDVCTSTTWATISHLHT